MKNRKYRRTVSLNPETYLQLDSLSRKLQMPKTQIAELLIAQLGRQHDVDPMTREQAKATLDDRLETGDEPRRWAQLDRMRREAFG